MELDPSLKAPMPERLLPMLPRAMTSPRENRSLVEAIFYGNEWILEPKWDGFRALAKVVGGRVTLLNKQGRPLSRDYSPVTQTLAQTDHDVALDGELIIVNSEGRINPQDLNRSLTERGGERLKYVIWDILYWEEYYLRRLPLDQRKAILREAIEAFPSSPLELCKYSEESSEKSEGHFGLLDDILYLGLEGVVAKKRVAPTDED